ncbi:MAG: hypothetical protein APF76_14715 [Desulfitibacter sp. BRH_c19]|nr:MAG: hypothetical protein APF76_14715 [Desulfitibacter sp. BRH_c19]
MGHKPPKPANNNFLLIILVLFLFMDDGLDDIFDNGFLIIILLLFLAPNFLGDFGTAFAE